MGPFSEFLCGIFYAASKGEIFLILAAVHTSRSLRRWSDR
jgi:hypothetical protein